MTGTTPVLFFESAAYAARPVFHRWGSFLRRELPDGSFHSFSTTGCGLHVADSWWREVPRTTSGATTETIAGKRREFFTLRHDNAVKFGRPCERCAPW